MDLVIYTEKVLNRKFIFYAMIWQRMVVLSDDLFNLKITQINTAKKPKWRESRHKIAVKTYIAY